MAAFALRVVGFFGCGKVKSTTTEPSESPLKQLSSRSSSLQLTWPGGVSGRGRAIRQTRRTQRRRYNSSSIANGLSFKLRRKKVTSQYNTITMTVNWRIGRGIRKRRGSSGN